MLEINTPAIGEGGKKIVYTHPLDSNKAIKLVKLNRSQRQSRREINTYKKLIRKNNTNWKHLPKFHGEISTNKGNGFVVDLIRDYDGAISKDLEFYIQQHGLSEYIEQWQEMKSYFITKNIAIGNDVSARNILVQRVDEHESVLILIDSLGDHVFIPLLSQFNFFIRRNNIRRLKRADEEMRRLYK